MSAEGAFLDALRTSPADDTARLVYADWLDEHDECEKADYLRGVSRLAATGFAGPHWAGLQVRVCELEDDLPADWTAAAGAAFEVVFLGLASPWVVHLSEPLDHRFRALVEERRVLYAAAPGVLIDRLRVGDALDTATDMNGAVAAAVHRNAGWGEYSAINRDQYVAQIEETGRAPFAARPTRISAEPTVRRFDVVAVEASDWRTPHRHQNPDYLAEPLCSLLGMRLENATALLYAGHPFVARANLSFVAAVECLGELRKAVKRHHLAGPLGEAVRLQLRARDGESEPVDNEFLS